MKLISHRGNINGRIVERENSPEYILESLNLGYDVELDVWYTFDILSDKFDWFLGHDNPTYEFNFVEFVPHFRKMWFHCKNLEALSKIIEWDVQYFWHEEDKFTLTSENYIWTFPGNPLTDRSICVLPEKYLLLENQLINCAGICSDYIKNYNY